MAGVGWEGGAEGGVGTEGGKVGLGGMGEKEKTEFGGEHRIWRGPRLSKVEEEGLSTTVDCTKEIGQEGLKHTCTCHGYSIAHGLTCNGKCLNKQLQHSTE